MMLDRAARVLLPCLMLALLPSLGCHKPAPLPRIAAVPDFQLADQHGKEITPAILRGKVWVANFMFTSCPDVCPLLTAKLASVRGKLRAERDSLAFVSLTVDPEVDTPEVLRRYATEQGAAHDGWYFLTGPIDGVRAVVVQGFKQAMEKQPAPPGKPYNVMHGSHFVLVDAALQIRGFYASDEPGMLLLVRDARRLVAGKAD